MPGLDFVKCKCQFLSLAYDRPSMRNRWGVQVLLLWQVYHLVNCLHAKYIGENRYIFQYKMFLALLAHPVADWPFHGRIILGSCWDQPPIEDGLGPFFRLLLCHFWWASLSSAKPYFSSVTYSMLERATSIPIVTCQTSFTMGGFDFLGPTSSNFVASMWRQQLFERGGKRWSRIDNAKTIQAWPDWWMIPEWFGHETISNHPCNLDPFSCFEPDKHVQFKNATCSAHFQTTHSPARAPATIFNSWFFQEKSWRPKNISCAPAMAPAVTFEVHQARLNFPRFVLGLHPATQSDNSIIVSLLKKLRNWIVKTFHPKRHHCHWFMAYSLLHVTNQRTGGGLPRKNYTSEF